MSELVRVDIYIESAYGYEYLEVISDLNGDYIRVTDLREYLQEHLRSNKIENLYSDLLKQLN